jgi:hypothetical protein
MINKNTIRLSFSYLFLLVLISISFYSYEISLKQKYSIKLIKPQYAADFRDDKVLVGASHNIFVAKVLKSVGVERGILGPETQFKAKVLYNIKGDLHGDIVISQTGGYDSDVIYVVGDEYDKDYLFKEGSTYLFSARLNDKKNWYTINSFPGSSKIISNNKNIDESKILALIESDTRVSDLKKAYPNEILINADVLNNNTRNSYKSIEKNQ